MRWLLNFQQSTLSPPLNAASHIPPAPGTPKRKKPPLWPPSLPPPSTTDQVSPGAKRGAPREAGTRRLLRSPRPRTLQESLPRAPLPRDPLRPRSSLRNLPSPPGGPPVPPPLPQTNPEPGAGPRPGAG